jgi:nucleotide-binding universal stress UspA family protein
MQFETIFCVTGVDDEDNALEEVIVLCQNTSAHLSVLVIGISPTPVVYSYGVGFADGGWAADLAAGKALSVKRVDAVEKQVQRAGISADVSISYSDSSLTEDIIGERARYADVTLVGANMNNEENLRDRTIYGALYHSAKPVLLSPASGVQSFDAKKIMIAWDSSLPSVRAVGHVIAQMKQADIVQIVMIDPVAANGGEPGADIAQYLARHGLNIEVERLAGAGRPVAGVLKQHAVDIDADLIVMGAYGQSKLQRLVFGGTTSAVLNNVSVPVLMAH